MWSKATWTWPGMPKPRLNRRSTLTLVTSSVKACAKASEMTIEAGLLTSGQPMDSSDSHLPINLHAGSECFAMFCSKCTWVQDYASARAQLVDASANNVLLDIMKDWLKPCIGP